MRRIGVSAYGIRMPIINRGDDLPPMIVDALCSTLTSDGIRLSESDVIGVTESLVAKAQNNYIDISDIAADIKNKFGNNPVGVVFPILSRNRFYNILKGICMGASKVYIHLQVPQDEVGNPVMDVSKQDSIIPGLISASEFKELSGGYTHPFTGVDYVSLYESISDNAEVYLSADPRDILKLTAHTLVCEIHNRERTKMRLKAAGAQTLYTLADILCSPINGSGYNPEYGVLGSNLSTGTELKLFPRDCNAFVQRLRELIKSKTGIAPEVLIYGDGAFKDPIAGIWELADPVVSPGYTSKLEEQPNELKLKYLAEELFGSTPPAEKQDAITRMISEKQTDSYREGTTPRKYADLLGSLCDLMSGSGDKGTPLILIQGYFDNYASG